MRTVYNTRKNGQTDSSYVVCLACSHHLTYVLGNTRDVKSVHCIPDLFSLDVAVTISLCDTIYCNSVRGVPALPFRSFWLELASHMMSSVGCCFWSLHLSLYTVSPPCRIMPHILRFSWSCFLLLSPLLGFFSGSFLCRSALTVCIFEALTMNIPVLQLVRASEMKSK